MPDTEKHSLAKVIELIGSSSVSWEDAALNAVKEASRTIWHIKGVYLKECTAKVENGRIVEYRANVKITFIYESDGEKPSF
ncbi:MAG TPA: dodecin domain-containing protein [Methanolinea sp.]|nr:dodecin domain-containing protein [Methanolinea sp.]